MRGLALVALLTGGCTALFPFDYAAAPADARPPADVAADAAPLDGPGDPPCPEGFDRCGGASCIDLRSNSSRCGSCSVVCALSNATAGCEDAGCVAASCNPGYGDCDGDPRTGCEANLSTSSAHCGRCGNACAATAACTEGACRASACTGALGNCDGDGANGCETDTATSPVHCGGCGRRCALPNATATCAAGACRVGACAAGFGDCDGDPANGCEAPLTTLTHCGRCGNTCPTAGATVTCAAGACTGACATGRGNCDGVLANGCEADLTADATNCGACGMACVAGRRCSGGVCMATCAAGETPCGTSCVNVATNVRHCGACDRACAVAGVGTPTCAAGVCGVACPAGQGDCDGDPADGCEVSLAGNVSHCNACGTTCMAPPNSTASCGAAGCGYVCGFGWADCNGRRDDGCETATASDVANCGRCEGRCSPANAVGVCTQGGCRIGACAAGFADCDGSAANGCEVDTRTSMTHCGGCGRACALANAAEVCRGGSCQITMCNGAFANCDDDPSNGCEVNTASTPAHCGACGRRCATSCVNAACCGGAGEPCCGGSCSVGVCTGGQCSAVCGLVGQPCCNGSCAVGALCNTRVDPVVCALCGRRGQPCCASNMCREGMCRSNTCM